MIVLDDTTRKLQAALSGAVNADEPEFVASFVDIAAPDTYEPGTEAGETTGAAAVDIVSAPAAGRKRQLKFLSIFNKDDMAVEVTLQLDDNGTDRVILVITLAVGSTLLYTDGEGFRVIDTTGNILVTANP